MNFAEPPHDEEAERAVLGSMLLDSQAVAPAVGILSGEEFFLPKHRTLFELIAELHRDGRPIDGILIRNQLMAAGKFDAIGGYDFLTDLIGSVPSALRVAEYALIVRDRHQRRRHMTALHHAYDAASRGEPYLPQLEGLRAELPAEVIPRDGAEMILADEPLSEPVVYGLLRRGDTMNIVGASKSRKSWLLLDLALAIATGMDWLNWGTKKGRVLLIDNELRPATIAKRLNGVARVRFLRPEDFSGQIAVLSLRGNLCDIFELCRRYEHHVLENQYSVVILDALYRFLPKGFSESDNAAFTEIYNGLDRFASRTNAAVLIVHHASKGDQSGKSVTDIGSGAGSQSRACDAHLALRLHEVENAVTLEAVCRDWPPPEPIVIRWEYPQWRVDGDLDPKAIKQPARRSSRSPASGLTGDAELAKFIDLIPTTPTTRDAIVELATQKSFSVRKAKGLLDLACEDGRVVRETVKRGRHLFRRVEREEEAA